MLSLQYTGIIILSITLAKLEQKVMSRKSLFGLDPLLYHDTIGRGYTLKGGVTRNVTVIRFHRPYR